MDGPGVNLKFYNVFKDTCLDGIFDSLIDNGVCKFRGAFQQVLKFLAGNWNTH